jgi:hypothetical protein
MPLASLAMGESASGLGRNGSNLRVVTSKSACSTAGHASMCCVSSLSPWKDGLTAAADQQSTDARCAVYFAIPEPFELEAFRADGLAGTLPCEARACSLSLSARVFRSLFRPLSNRSENSRGSIEESKLVSGEGFDHRLQARRIKRRITRRFLISRPTQKPPSAR